MLRNRHAPAVASPADATAQAILRRRLHRQQWQVVGCGLAIASLLTFAFSIHLMVTAEQRWNTTTRMVKCIQAKLNADPRFQFIHIETADANGGVSVAGVVKRPEDEDALCSLLQASGLEPHQYRLWMVTVVPFTWQCPSPARPLLNGR